MSKLQVGTPVQFFHDGLTHNGVVRGPFAAVITQVHGDDCASLSVTAPFGVPYSEGSVPLAVPGQSQGRCFDFIPGPLSALTEGLKQD